MSNEDHDHSQNAYPESTMELADGDLEVHAVGEQGAVPPLPQSAPEDGRYVDVGEIGRGGMGRVHNVRDKRLQRSVAMKVLDPAMAKEPRLATRFVEEAQIQAQLDHPNIPPMHDLGVDPSGAVFFTMKLVRGTSLSDWLQVRTRPPGSPERLGEGVDVFVKACDAVAFAHARGVLHRDLKPGNIMLGEFGEVYVMDWGLALTKGDSVVVSTRRPSDEEHYVAGTPAYISPEAARGEPCDERADIFGLGAILYAIVTGGTVYGNISPLEAVEAARRGDVHLSESAFAYVGASRKLVRILEKALAPAREDRYRSVIALRADVHQFLRGGLTMPRRTFAPGTRIIKEGAPGDQAFIIVEGTCEAYKTVQGARRPLRRMGPGDVFGETAGLSDSPRTATVEAIDQVTALVIDRVALEDGLGFDTWLGTLVKALAQRFRELDARVTSGT